MSKQSTQKTIKTSIGGQAVIEGVMMRGPKVTALSVRLPDNTISTEEWPTPSMSAWYKRTPFVRGIFNFVDSLTTGYKSLMKAAEKAGLDDEEEEASPFEQKLRNALGDKFMPFLEGCILVVSLIIAIFFFTFLPTTIVNFFRGFFEHPLALSALEGVIKMVILIGYLAAVSNMSDIRRVFMYHGAEHNTPASTRAAAPAFWSSCCCSPSWCPPWSPGTISGCASDSRFSACPSSCRSPMSASSMPAGTTTCSPASSPRRACGPSA